MLQIAKRHYSLSFKDEMEVNIYLNRVLNSAFINILLIFNYIMGSDISYYI